MLYTYNIRIFGENLFTPLLSHCISLLRKYKVIPFISTKQEMPPVLPGSISFGVV